MFYLDSAKKVRGFVEALQAEGVAAAGCYNAGMPGLAHLRSLEAHHSEGDPHRRGLSLDLPLPQGSGVNYSEDMNPKTLEYLSRVVHLDIPAQMTEADCDMVVAAVRKVAAALA